MPSQQNQKQPQGMGIPNQLASGLEVGAVLNESLELPKLKALVVTKNCPELTEVPNAYISCIYRYDTAYVRGNLPPKIAGKIRFRIPPF